MSPRRRGRHHSHGGAAGTPGAQGTMPGAADVFEGAEGFVPEDAAAETAARIDAVEETALPNGEVASDAAPANAGETPQSDEAVAQLATAADGQQRQGAERRGPREREPRPSPRADQDQPEEPGDVSSGRKPACTVAQLRRFIKSRPYVPLHELRRRFAIEGPEDEVGSFPTERGTLYVGLPQEEAALLGELVRDGEVGCELLLDPTSPAVIGVFPMRPVARG